MRVSLISCIIITTLIVNITLSYAVSSSLPGGLNKSQGNPSLINLSVSSAEPPTKISLNKGVQLPETLSRSLGYSLQLPANLSALDPETPVDFFSIKGLQFHCDEKIDGTISPIAVNGRLIHPYAHSYKKVNQDNIETVQVIGNIEPFPILPQLELGITLTAEIGNEKEWKHITSAQEGTYQSEDSMDVKNQVILVSALKSTPLTRTLDAAGLLALSNTPISSSEIKSYNSLKYSGKQINDIEGSSNRIGAVASASATLNFRNFTIASIDKTLLDKGQIQSMNAEFLYNKEFSKESSSNLKSGIFVTTDSALNPTYTISSIDSTLDYGISSHSSGVADISYAQSQNEPADMQLPVVNEGRNRYVGNFDITTKIHMNSALNLSQEEDDWLPCCYKGFDDMNTLDKKAFKSATGVFDCTCFEPTEKARFPRIN